MSRLAQVAIDQLVEWGVVDFCICPGSRSTPLALAIARHPKAHSYIFHDEIEVPASTPFNISCTWNNSAENPNIIHNPPVEISDGERTDEEMCFGFTLVSFN